MGFLKSLHSGRSARSFWRPLPAARSRIEPPFAPSTGHGFDQRAARFACSQHSILQPWPEPVVRSEALYALPSFAPFAPSLRALRGLPSALSAPSVRSKILVVIQWDDDSDDVIKKNK